MSCFDEYITLNEDIPSRSNLYADSLPGIDSEMIDGLAKEGKELVTWDVLYKRAYDGLVGDVTKLLNTKFNTDLKLVARETSVFKDGVNFATGLAGVQIGFQLPKYARIHVISAGIFSDQDYDSPDVPIYVYDEDENGELLFETSSPATEGRNTINIDKDFETNLIFVAYNPLEVALRETENKRYSTPYYSFTCNECAFDCGGYEGTVKQINGGGLNVKYTVYCSAQKFVCENLNLFAQSLFWKIGVVIQQERRFGERLNKFTTMGLERHEELTAFYLDEYTKELTETIKTHNIREDQYCFPCKRTVSSRSQTP